MQTNIKVGDVMTRDPVVVKTTDTIKEAAQLMAKENVGSVLVKKNKKLVGIVTDEDFVRKAVIKNKDCEKVKVEKIMEKNLITISPSLDIFKALNKMSKFNIRHLPVKFKGKMVGFVTLKDILKVEPELFDLMLDEIQIRQEEQRDYFLKQMSD